MNNVASLLAERTETTPARYAGPTAQSSRSEVSIAATLAFVEQAANAIRTLQQENTAANRQIVGLREQLQREKLEREAEQERVAGIVQDLRRKLTMSEAQAVEVGSLATAAIKRCEDMALKEAKTMQDLQEAEGRIAEVENCLSGLQQAIAFEFSSVLS